MTNTILIFLLGLILGAIVLYIFFNKKDSSNNSDNSLVLIQNQIGDLARRLDQRMEDSQKSISESMRTQFGHIKDITESIIRLDETNKQVVNFAEQLQGLQDILKNPKQRGVLGEYFLEETLKNVTFDDVILNYNTYFVPANAYLVIVGDVNFKEVKK